MVIFNLSIAQYVNLNYHTHENNTIIDKKQNHP